MRRYWSTVSEFLSTLSLRRATSHGRHSGTESPNFYPRSPCGERRGLHALLLGGVEFLSTLSLRRATHPAERRAGLLRISIHALLAESDQRRRTSELGQRMISIHALLAESDTPCPTRPPRRPNFYPRSPCGERRRSGTTPRAGCYFYPRSPCGERQNQTAKWYKSDKISIHALLAESDHDWPPVRDIIQWISIHALLAESDKIPYQRQIDQKNFYPRSPCGERPYIMTTIICTALFLSTLSLRRATLGLVSMICLPLDFYPRSPCGERRVSSVINNVIDNFYPRSPCGERQHQQGCHQDYC